ncbi:hypothetical protein [Euzebya tangerina]|uniref:hypothetical protein n=1 Tax=Euzebya tangerina TaxID=591198 RepID=UPI000E317E8D|nr:hypothetical protein [Euzebya tangerina]
MTTSSTVVAGPALLVVAEDLAPAWQPLSEALASVGIVQPDSEWMERFLRHVRLAKRQQEQSSTPGLVTGELMMWLGHQLHLGHGMLLDARAITDLSSDLAAAADSGMIEVAVLTNSPEDHASGFPLLSVDILALAETPAQTVRHGIMDQL